MSFKNQKKTIEKILSVLKNGSVSSSEYNSTKVPFFLQNKENNFDIEFNKIEDIDIPLRLNRNIILIYKILGNSKKEIYLDEWTILSLEEALEQYKNYCNEGQSNVFNIGYRYMGLGHVEVISCDLESHLLFFRNDGGSNDFDRQYNYNDIIKNGAKPHKKFYFSDWFYNIKFEEN